MQLITEVERLQAEIERLKQYTDPKLFAAACIVLGDWERYTITQGAHSLLDALEADMPELREAVTWWDSLPWKPEDGGIELPKYDPGPDSRNQANPQSTLTYRQKQGPEWVRPEEGE